MPRTTPLTKQVALTGTPTHLGSVLPEDSAVGVRITVPNDATSSVWVGGSDVTPETGGLYRPGSSTRLPTTSFRDWYAVTDGASVTVVLEVALGGNAGGPEWSDAGSTSAGVSGPGGEALATEATVDRTADAAELLASTVGTSTPAPADPGIVVRAIDPTIVTFAPLVGAPGGTVYSPQLGENPVEDDEGKLRLGVVIKGGEVRQGFGDRGKQWFVASSPDGVAVEQVATADRQDEQTAAVASLEAEVADDATSGDVALVARETTVAAVEDAVDELEGDAERTADATESAAAKLGTLAAQDASVDGLEGLATTANTNTASAAASLATIAAICTITLTQLRDAITALLEAIRDRLDRRASDPLTTAQALVVRPIRDACTFAQTTPGTPTYFLDVRGTAGRLCALHIVNQTAGMGTYVFVCDAAALGSATLASRRLLDFIDGQTAGKPGTLTIEFADDKVLRMASGIVVVASSSPTALTPAVGVTMVVMAWHKAVES